VKIELPSDRQGNSRTAQPRSAAGILKVLNYRTSNVGECPRMSANVVGLSNREPRPFVLLKGVDASISLIVRDSLFAFFCRGDPSQPREVREVREHFRPYVLINIVK